MPHVGVQTDLSCTKSRDDSWLWVDEFDMQELPTSGSDYSSSDNYSYSDSDSEFDENLHIVSQFLQEDAWWPTFPRGYFTDLGNAHCRWGASKSYKKEVNCVPIPCHEEFSQSWVQPRFHQWLDDRHLAKKLAFVQVGHVSDPAFSRSPWFVKYKYRPTEHIPHFHDSEYVYHGTYFPVLARILHTGRLHASDGRLNLGMESHWHEPVVYTAATMDHGLGYSWPSSALKDNLYYKVLLQCEISSRAVMKRHKGEVLVADGHVVIRSVFLFFNCAIAQGEAKGADHNCLQNLELLPFRPGESLRFSPLRASTWHS